MCGDAFTTYDGMLCLCYTQMWRYSTLTFCQLLPDFPLEESHDDTLCSAFDEVIGTGGHMVHHDAALTCSHFVSFKDRLYRVSRDTCTEKEHAQLLVPKSCWKNDFPNSSLLSYDAAYGV